MKHIYILFLVVLINLSCKNEVDQLPFTSLEYTYDSGWNNVYTVKINKSGKTSLFQQRFGKENMYYQLDLEKCILDSISNLLKNINYDSPDIIYPTDCIDCGKKTFLILGNNKQLKIQIEDINNESDNFEFYYHASEYMMSIIKRSIIKLQQIHFSSKTRDINNLPLRLEN